MLNYYTIVTTDLNKVTECRMVQVFANQDSAISSKDRYRLNALIQKAEDGDAEYQYLLSVSYRDGQHGKKDFGKALYWLRKAADNDWPAAQLQLGQAYYAGKDGVAKNYALALQYLTQISRDTYTGTSKYRMWSPSDKYKGVSKFLMGMIYIMGEYGVDKDINLALICFMNAAEHNYLKAICKLGQLHYEGNDAIVKDHRIALDWYTKGAKQGNMYAQYVTGMIYYHGKHGVMQDYKSALYWLFKAAEQSYVHAQYCMGIIYSNGGDGVSKNDKLARAWYRKAAQQGHLKAKQCL